MEKSITIKNARMSSSKHNFRSSFGNQPAQFVIIDIGWPMSNATKDKILQSMKQVINLSAQLAGKSRLPAFGLGVLDLQYTKHHRTVMVGGNLNGIIECLDSLLKQNASGVKMTIDDYTKLLFTAVTDILSDFTSRSETKKSEKKIWLGWPSQIQISLVTGKKASPIIEIFSDIINLNNISSLKLKKIDIIEVKCEDKLDLCKIIRNSGFINSILSNDSYANLDLIFKEWLLEASSYEEHLRITLNKELNLILKCDMKDLIINPDTIPFGHRFKLGKNQSWVSSMNSIDGPNDVNIYDLKVVRRITSGSRTSLFGLPIRLVPTECWKLTMDQLKDNQLLFNALYAELVKSNQSLLTELLTQPNSPDAMTTYFLITADGENNLLLNSAAPMELQLPNSSDISNIEVSEEAKILIQKSLEKLPIVEEYSPSDFRSNLYGCIEAKNIKQTPTKLSYPLKNTSSPIDLKNAKRKLDRDAGMENLKKIQMNAAMDTPGEYVPEFVPLKKVIKKSPKKRMSLKKQKCELDKVSHPAYLAEEIRQQIRNTTSYRERDLELEVIDFLK